MKRIIVICSALLITALNAYAQDVSIDGNGNVTTGVINADGGNLEVTGILGEDAVRGLTSGANAAGVYGENTSNGVGVYGYSSTGDAGYFQGNTRVTGNLTVNGSIINSGLGTVTQINTGNGLQGGPITASGAVDLKLNISGGLSKKLGAGSDELGVAAGGITSYHIQNYSILFDDIDQNGCIYGETMVWNGVVWTCGSAMNTQCDDQTCLRLRVDDGVNTNNVLDTTAQAGAADTLYWGSQAVSLGSHVISLDGLSGGAVTGDVTIDGNVSLAAGSGGQTMTFGNAGNDSSVFNGAVSFNDDVQYDWGSATERMTLYNSSTSSGTYMLGIDITGAGSSFSDGIRILSSGTGIITDGIDVSDAEITNAINIGSNNIAGTNFSLDGATGTVSASFFSGDGSGLTNIPDTDTTCLDGGVTCNFAGSTSEGGPATIALSLNANGTNCAAGQFAAGVDASGNAEGCVIDDDRPDNDAEVPDAITVSGNVTSSATISLNTTASAVSGRIAYDAINDRIAVGDGVSVDYFYPGPHTVEADPLFSASPAQSVTAGQITNWDTAFSWGNHASAGYDMSNDAWTGTGNVYITSGYVGIGTTTPSTTLHIESRSDNFASLRIGSDNTYDAALILFTDTGDWNIGVDQSDDGKLKFGSNNWVPGNSTRLTIDTSGRVGIGTSTPAEKLDVSGNARVTGDLVVDGKISSSGTKSLVVGASEVTAQPNSDLNIHYAGLYAFINASPGTGAPEYMHVPLKHIPDDAYVTGISCSVYDNSTTAQMAFGVFEVNTTGSSNTKVNWCYSGSSGGCTNSYTYASTSVNTLSPPVTPFTIDRSNYSYNIAVWTSTGTCGSNCKFHSCKITYSE